MKKILVVFLSFLLLFVLIGCQQDEEVDVVTTASIVNDADSVVNGLSKDGVWIVATLNDITLKEDLMVEGEFTDDGDVVRKLALYTQDEDRNITASFTLTAPKMIVKSENFKIQGGTFKGDVYVEANGFQISKQQIIEGNLIFKTQEYMDSFIMKDDAKVTGSMKVE